jgi:outer membrane receptor protein involved in Fe transport
VGSGDALGTPVIRGVSENRIKILNDGVGLNHQQFSFRHSPNLEVAFAEKIEVVKGPLSVLHGPDAMGGVINVISAPLPTAFDGKPALNGNVKTSYESNSSRKSIQAGLQGAVGGFGWRIGVLERKSGDMETPEQVLDNTQFEQTNGELHLGYAGEWGSIKLKASHWENETGYYRPEDFLLTLDDDFMSLEGWHPLGRSELSWVAGHQVNRRKAYPVELNGAPAVDLKLETQSGKLTWRQPRYDTDQLKLNGTFALEYSEMDNTPYAKKKLLPAYNNKSWAVIAFQELNVGGTGEHGWVISSGLRLDTQDLVVPVDPSRELDEAFDETYHTVTGTAGFVYKLTPHLSWAGTLGRGWRAPTAFELFANGIHGGVSAVQLGNRSLSEETNFNYETALRMLNTHFSGSITAYETRYSDYIYLRDSGEIQNNLPVFVYEQGDVTMRGLELEGEWFPREYLKLG